MCPQLKTSHHLLSIRLSRTLINRRLFLRRGRKIPPYSKTKLKTSDANVYIPTITSKDTSDDEELECPSLDTSKDDTCSHSSKFNSGYELYILLAIVFWKTLLQYCRDAVKILAGEHIVIGRGIFLKMNSTGIY